MTSQPPKDAGGVGQAPSPDASPSASARRVDETPGRRAARIAAELDALRQKQASADSGLSRAAMVGLLLTFVMIAVAWASTLHHIWHRWFPAWDSEGYTLGRRLTEGDSYYTHGPLVLLVSAVIAGLIYKRVGLPVDRKLKATIPGWILLILSTLLHLISVYADVAFTSGFALIGVLGGLVLIWGGLPLARAYWLPIVFLVFMVPLPEMWISDLNFQLKMIASRSAVWITNTVFSVPAFVDGSYVHFTPGPDGEPKTLVVESVCSGLRSLIALVCFASLFALVCRVKGFWRIFLLAMAAPVAVASNIVRITALNLVAHHYGVQQAGPEGWFHDFSGFAVFIVALGILFAMERAIMGLSYLLKRNWTDERLLGYLDPLVDWPHHPLNPWRPAAMGVMVSVTALSILFAPTTRLETLGNVAAEAVDSQIELVLPGDQEPTALDSVDIELDQWTRNVVQTNDYVYRRFHKPAERVPQFDLLIVFSEQNRKGTHPPDVCLTGSGEILVSKRIFERDVPGVGMVPMAELITQRGARRTLFYYTYKCGDSYTPSFFMQQLTIFLNGLRNRNPAGALIRFTAPMSDHDPGQARQTLDAAVDLLMPQVDGGLP